MTTWQFIGIWFLGSAAFCLLWCVGIGNWMKRWDRETDDYYKEKEGRES